jgi:hypothetical protein
MDMREAIQLLEENAERTEGIEESLAHIAGNSDLQTEALRSIKNELSAMRSELVDAATSKKSVPSIVIIYLLVGGFVFFVTDKVTNSNTSLRVDPRGLHIEQGQHHYEHATKQQVL